MNDLDLPDVLRHWRRHPADAFDDALRTEVLCFVGGVSSTIPEWRAAARGDAAAAVGIVIRSRIPERISLRVDMAMTTLLACAFQDAGAALVLSHMLCRMPLDPHDRARLGASWLLHKAWLASRKYRRLGPIPRLRDGGDAA